MKKIKTTFIVLTALIMVTHSQGQTNKPAANYLNVSDPIVFDNKSFNLNWSSHPAANFYKQEYIAKGDQADKYKMMVMLDAVTGEANIKNVVGAKLTELKKMKEANPVVTYQVFDNSKIGEYLLDFLLSANAPDGSISIVERNVYRYKAFTDKSGKRGVLLFGISVRGYGPEVDRFFAALKTSKSDLVNKVAVFKMPVVSVAPGN